MYVTIAGVSQKSFSIRQEFPCQCQSVASFFIFYISSVCPKLSVCGTIRNTSLSVTSERDLKNGAKSIMISSLESGFDSHVSLNVFSGTVTQGVCRCWKKKRRGWAVMKKRCPLLQNLFFIGCCFDFKSDLSPFFLFFSPARPFRFPKR